MKLSIITINLNNAVGLRITIDSVVSQTFAGYEYIIIDGGSTDDSVEVIKEYSEKLAYWTSESDTGIYNAMNKGIRKAAGEYCLFLNSGDFLSDKGILEGCFKNAFTEDIIYGNVIHDRAGKHVIYKLPSVLSFYDFFADSIAHPCTFIKRSLFDDIGMYNESYRIVSDWEFFLKALFINHVSVRYIDMEISVVNCEGISMNSGVLCKKERSAVLKELFPGFITDYEKLRSYRSTAAVINTSNKFIRSLADGINYIIRIKKKVFQK